MNGKIRVSIVATALHGSETKPYLNLVNNTPRNTSHMNKSADYGDNLFSNSHQIDKNIVNSIEGATALKLDESYEIKSSEEQNTLINDFETNEENKKVWRKFNLNSLSRFAKMNKIPIKIVTNEADIKLWLPSLKKTCKV